MSEIIKTQCAIAGGGPAGVMLGFLLARQGVDVVVMEKWPDFFRDFRGDTIHPSTMEVLYELGLLDAFLKLPHNKTKELGADIENHHVPIADFSHLPVQAPFVAFIPQWDFLNFIAEEAKQYPSFTLLMDTEVHDVVREGDKVAGVTTKKDNKEVTIKADLVVAADGRHSTVREKAGFTTESSGAPMDVLWFKISRTPEDPEDSLGRVSQGNMMALIERGDYWQCGFLIPKGEFEMLRTNGIYAFQKTLRELVPWMGARVKEVEGWEQVKLLTVTIDHLETWHRPGVLIIGDAAHAMSPIGGVGINLAIQDAVAAANILGPAFKKNTLSQNVLRTVQQRRKWPARLTQRMQVFLQNRIIKSVLTKKIDSDFLPWQFRLLQRFPVLRRIPARLIGIGFLPEHIRK